MYKYLVTGASGNFGKYVLDELLTLKKDIKAGVHNMDKAKGLFGDKENVDLVQFDFLDKKTFGNALEGVGAIFLVRPPNLAEPEKDMLPFLEAAKEKGIEKVVFVSLLGVEKNPIVPHRKKLEENLLEYIDKHKNNSLYLISGSPNMVKETRSQLKVKGIKRRNIINDSFRGYK